MLTKAAPTLVQVVSSHASEQPHAVAFTFLAGSGQEPCDLTFAELDRRAQGVAVHLRSHGVRKGDPVLILLPAGLEYVAALVGCFYAGAIAVPTYPPGTHRLARAKERIRAVLDNAGAVAVLGHDEALHRVSGEAGGAGCALVEMPTAGNAMQAAASWTPPTLKPSDGAILQYTSGSTSRPKGILLSHRNILCNEAQALAAMETSQTDVFVTWLPPFHDMGLLGGIMHPLFAGIRSVMLAPEAFIRKPVRWLRAATAYGATILLAPNFAYELCVRRIPEGERQDLDLSRVRIAFNGAEPIDPATLDRFSEAFAAQGFNGRAFYPAYGLAESSVFVTAGDPSAAPHVECFDRAGLELGLALPTSGAEGSTRALVGCGRAGTGTDLVIVDPVTRHPVPARNTGEIWLRGPSVAAGYWRNAEATGETFGARLAGDTGPPFLRTGDLGFIHGGELFITGRIKEVIIIRGRNLWPHDIERTVQALDPSLVPDSGAAFSVERDGHEELVVVQEFDKRLGGDADGVLRTLPDAIMTDHDVAPLAVVLIKRGSLLKTASGKVRRREMRAKFESGALQTVARFDRTPHNSLGAHGHAREEPSREPAQGRMTMLPPRPVPAAATPALTQVPDTKVGDRAHSERDILDFLLTTISTRLGVRPDALDIDLTLAHYGMDSLAMAELTEGIERFVGRDLPTTFSYDNPSIADLVRAVQALESEPASAPVRPTSEARRDQPDDVAIIGMGCRVPGAPNPEALWELLMGRVDAVTEVPDSRWQAEEIYDPEPGRSGRVCNRVGGFLSGIDQFDPEFFGLSQREAERMDPRQRLFLEVAWEALEDAGIDPRSLSGSETGVFVGAHGNDYAMLYGGDLDLVDADFAVGNAASVIANRLSYVLNLRGPSQTIDTACSSGLVALQAACEALRRGECRLAVVGGVNVLLSPEASVSMSSARALSPTGRCRTFSHDADGFVRSEGVGVLVLQSLTHGPTPGMPPRATIAGCAVNHSGRSNGILSPNGRAQQAVIRDALARAHIRGAQLDFVEAHGVGAPVADAVELEALGAVLSEHPRDSPCWVGSVKTNIGHTETASGMISLIKAILSLEHELIPSHLHLERATERVDLSRLPIDFPRAPVPWPRGERTRYAGVSAFGFSGTNAHVIIREPARVPTGSTPHGPRPSHLALLSANDTEALAKRSRQLRSRLPRHPIGDICHSLNVGRAHYRQRAAIVARDTAALDGGLKSLAGPTLEDLAGGAPPPQPATTVLRGQAQPGRPPTIALAFGDSPVPEAQIEELAASHPLIRLVLSRMASQAERLLPGSGKLLMRLLSPSLTLTVERGETAEHVARLAVHQALFQFTRELGIEPLAVGGYGVGEYAAACAAGVLDWDAALALVIARAQTLASLTPGAPIQQTLAGFRRQVELADLGAPRRRLVLATGREGQTPTEHFKAQVLRTVPRDAASLDWSDTEASLHVHIGSDPGTPIAAEDVVLLPPSTLAWEGLQLACARLYTTGADLRWDVLDSPFDFRRVPLPAYPYARRRCWLDFPHRQLAAVETSERTTPEQPPISHPLLRTTRRVTQRRSGFVRTGNAAPVDPKGEESSG